LSDCQFIRDGDARHLHPKPLIMMSFKTETFLLPTSEKFLFRLLALSLRFICFFVRSTMMGGFNVIVFHGVQKFCRVHIKVPGKEQIVQSD